MADSGVPVTRPRKEHRWFKTLLGTFSWMLCCHVSPAAYRKNGVATAPLLTFTCPKTKERASVDIETDAQTLRASWKSWFEVKCPYCGEVHKISVRDAYLNDAIDIVGRPARPRSMHKRRSG